VINYAFNPGKTSAGMILSLSFFLSFFHKNGKMNNFPAEILKNIGLYLNQINQKSCCLVCKAWRQTFQSLVFQKAVLLNQKQLDTYYRQDARLKKSTQSLHFNVSLTDDLLEEFAKASPNVHTLTLFVNILNQLSIPKTISVLKNYWWKNLAKVRMDDLLLSKVLPLLSHQLEDVTGDYGAFYNAKKNGNIIIPMPKLKILDIEGDGDDDLLTAASLNNMRVAYPRLKKLTVSYFKFDLVDDEREKAELVPFPFVRSFHILNCVDTDYAFLEIASMFTDLKESSFLRSTDMERENMVERQNQYLELVSKHPNIRDLKIDYLFGRRIIPQDIYYYARSLKFLTSVHMELPSETGIITKRNLIDINTMISILNHLKKLKIWGLSHIETGESFEHYLCGTVGYYDLEGHEDDRRGLQDRVSYSEDEDDPWGRQYEEPPMTSEERQEARYLRFHAPREDSEEETDDEDSEDFFWGHSSGDDLDEEVAREEDTGFRTLHQDGIIYEAEVFDDEESLFGNGEKLIKNGICTTTVKKRMPRYKEKNGFNYLEWQVDEIPRFEIWFKDDIKTFGLTSLYLEMATIKTPSFYWLTRHCPLLEELHVLQTEPYPTCQVYLGDLIHTFSLSFDKRYTKFNPPFIRLFDQDYNQKCLEWIPNEKKFQQSEKADYINATANIYKIEIEYKRLLRDLTICGTIIDLV
jgi:hypothetical protein